MVGGGDAWQLVLFINHYNQLCFLLISFRAVIAPMLRVFDNESAFSNFWYGMDESVSNLLHFGQFCQVELFTNLLI